MKLWNKLRERRGENYLDTVVLVLAAVMAIALAVQVFPAFLAKHQLDVFAAELCREAEIAGRIGTETSQRERELREETGLSPSVSWSETGKIQLNQGFTVTLTAEYELGLFGGFGSFPVPLRAKASGKGEVYWK